MPRTICGRGVTTIVSSLHSIDQPYPLRAFLDTLRVAPNTVWTAGHTWTRKHVMGLANRAPAAVELDSMRAIVGEAMSAGAFGLGTGLEYTPAVYATLDEVITLARVASGARTLYVTHLRDEGANLLPAIEEAVTVARSVGQPVHISHIKSTGASNWGRTAQVFAMLDAAERAGTRVSFDVYPYLAYSTYSDLMFPPWALAGGTAAFAGRAADPAIRARIHSEMREVFRSQSGNTLESVQFRVHPTDSTLNGRTLADHLRARGLPLTLDAGFEALIDLQAAGGFIGVFTGMDERDVEAFLLHPRASVSADGDLVTPGIGFPHPRSYGAFPRVLARYVRERRVLSLEDAIHRMTGRPATVFGLIDRGVLQQGAFADIVVFDADRIADRATYGAPHQYAEGVVHLLVNGQAVLRGGATTGSRPGVAIRRRP